MSTIRCEMCNAQIDVTAVEREFAAVTAQRDLALGVLIELEHNVSRINRYRDAERHPDVGLVLAKARTVIAQIKEA